MTRAGCGVLAAGRQSSAPRPLRTATRLPAEEKEATNKTVLPRIVQYAVCMMSMVTLKMNSLFSPDILI
ncbi:5'-Nucleotidase Domain-Containing Protein 3 [Manis pentadactyla]|nr:5'-Nucleotidase Domain-Containing Protein 3 [Manis pentadactyla]